MNIVPRVATQVKNIAIMYHDKDQGLKEDLGDHLTLLRREGLISIIEATRTMPHLDIILFLISPSFIGNDTFLNAARYAVEHKQAERFIAIRMRECAMPPPFDKIQGLPRTGPAIADLRSKDGGLAQVVAEIRQVIGELNHGE